jgi:hypothetical protein
MGLMGLMGRMITRAPPGGKRELRVGELMVDSNGGRDQNGEIKITITSKMKPETREEGETSREGRAKAGEIGNYHQTGRYGLGW